MPERDHSSLHPRRARLKRVAVWTAAPLLLVLGCVAGMPFARIVIAEIAPGLFRAAAIFYSPVTYGLGIGLGAVLAAIGSWVRHRSVLIAVLAGMLSWAYVAYYVYTRNANAYEEIDRRHRNARRFAIAVGICCLMLGWYVLAWVGTARALNSRTISFDREPYLRTVFAPLIGYCDADWPGSVWLRVTTAYGMGFLRPQRAGTGGSPAAPGSSDKDCCAEFAMRRVRPICPGGGHRVFSGIH
jgi:hypothetical protein